MRTHKIKKVFLVCLLVVTSNIFCRDRDKPSCCTPCSVCLAPISPCQLFPLYGKTFFLPRSQGVDLPRDMVGTHRFLHRYDGPCYYGALSFTPQYMHSYKDDRLAENYFATDILRISGSKNITRAPEAFLADYFGLSPTFESTVELHPTVQNFVADIGLLGQWKRLWATLHIPIVWTRWNFELYELICKNQPFAPYPAKYMSINELAAPINSFIRAWQGGVTWGDVKQGLFNNVVGPAQTESGVADIHLNIGYDIWLREHGHAGFYARLVAPTGTRSNAHYLFEPVIGNGHHWEMGLGFNGRVVIWEKDGDQTWSMFFDGYVTHLFASRQCRAFDLRCNCVGSRYMLLKVFENNTYTRTLIPAVNITTMPCDVKIDAQLDIVAMFGYECRGFEFDIGYNPWIRSREIITNLYGCIPENRYGIKGIQNVVDESDNPSSLTQHCANLHGNFLSAENQNKLADNPSPRYLTTSDLDVCSAESHMGFTHKLFIYLGYAWATEEQCTYMPFVGAGFSIEFEGEYPDYTYPNKNCMSQYSVWMKVGTGY